MIERAALLEIALRAVQQHLEREEYTAAGDVVLQALARVEHMGAPAAQCKPDGMRSVGSGFFHTVLVSFHTEQQATAYSDSLLAAAAPQGASHDAR